MKTVQVTIDPNDPKSIAIGRIDPERVDAMLESDIADLMKRGIAKSDDFLLSFVTVLLRG